LRDDSTGEGGCVSLGGALLLALGTAMDRLAVGGVDQPGDLGTVDLLELG
jgi:hypothetical protein